MADVIDLSTYRSVRFQRTRGVQYDLASAILKRAAEWDLGEVVSALEAAGIAPDIVEYVTAEWRRLIEPGALHVRT